MSEVKFEGALCALCKPQDNKTLLKLLVTIRKEVEWPKNKDNITKIREKGCLKQFVAILQSQQRNALDVALSILGNCVMDRDCTRDVVGTYNILSPLNQLLKRYCKEDSINGRVFRILGNICQHRDQWGNTIIDRKPQVVTYIVDFIKKVSKDELPADENFSEATIMMAIRTLRLLLNCQTVMSLVKTFGVLKAVGSLFIKYSIDWQEGQKNKSLLENIIKLFQDYSRYKYYHSIIEMRNTDRGDSLIYLSNVLVLAPKRIVKIVMNFIRISQLKSELPIPEICDRFIEVLKKYSIIKEFDGECVEYIQCLCYLLEHPANRNSERCGKCIPLLIQLLQEFQEPSNSVVECCILLIATLYKCRYDDSLLFEQLRCNIIKILVEKLRWLVGSSTVLNVEHKNVKKRKYEIGDCKIGNKRYGINNGISITPVSPSSSEESFWVRQHSPFSSDDEMDTFSYTKYDRSPSPCSSTDSDMPWSSPGSSPKSFKNDISDSDSDDYSPVCSEADGAEFPLPLLEEDVESVPDHERFAEITELKEDITSEHFNDKNICTSLKVKLLTEITKLLKSFTKLRPSVPQLASEELLIALLKCSGNFESTFSSSVDTIELICRILDAHDYLIPLMQTEFIQTVYDLTEIQHSKWCTKCSNYLFVGQTILRKFTSLAESGVGKGDIAHKLLRGDSKIKKQLVLVIPYIVKNKYILARLMLNCGGLEILMKLLREDTGLKKRSIKVLCAMASRKLEIANPKDLTTGLNRPKVIADKYKLNEDCANIVTFKLDDGTFLKADRDFLSEKSDFFSRLLKGDFKESTEDEIALHNVELKSLRCLLHLLECVDKTESIEIDLDLDTLLDVIVLSDRYLMVDLCVSLTDCVEQFRISPETIPNIYRWSLESGTNLLRVESIAYALVANIMDAERFVMFENLFALGYSEQLVEDIQKLLVRYLTSCASEYDSHSRRNKIMAHMKSLRGNLLKQFS
ncbi:hypothetical protein NQ314_019623 [Rhamnusium bicolor]|uniref:BTB domain-containing protein n=1 Tax=Rhamnusium bicolor TaxID=1586634 RepID=A0AAV8WME3_9CUCU|nr:hypothetical protein NQ314_019623 [Rhamnusium bicolor]